jgi:hypothetical protein
MVVHVGDVFSDKKRYEYKVVAIRPAWGVWVERTPPYKGKYYYRSLRFSSLEKMEMRNP